MCALYDVVVLLYVVDNPPMVVSLLLHSVIPYLDVDRRMRQYLPERKPCTYKQGALNGELCVNRKSVALIEKWLIQEVDQRLYVNVSLYAKCTC